MNRRSFLRTSLAAGAFSLASFNLRASEKSGRRFRTAVIGCGWWAGNILHEAMASGACEIVGLCDVDERQFAAMLASVAAGTGDHPKTFRDFRELLADAKPEIVIIGTPDHWHALPMIAAVQAGAHVYVEKPISHTLDESRAMVAAARATGRVVQVGTHRRVSPHNLSAREFIRRGHVGEIGMIRCFVVSGGAGPEKPLPTQPAPKELDWDLWCGPAPLRPYNGGDPRDRTRAWSGAIHPRGFRHYLDYANGQLGDWGVHWLDQALWITGEKHPRHVYSTGGRPIAGPPVLTSDAQTSDAPDHQVATYRFGRFDLVWEHRKFGGNATEKGEPLGCHFHGTKGILHLGWKSGWTFHPAARNEPEVHEDAQVNTADGHNIRELWADFLHAIRAGSRPAADIAEVALANDMALLGMLSLRHGRSIEWDGERGRIIGDDAAARLQRRPYRTGWTYPET